jgi:predicted O-methyltransferase YrrM
MPMQRPPLVDRAEELARELGFELSCAPEAGRLLHALAAQRSRARVGEIGSGAGVATAWLASALRPGVPLYTVERDRRLAAAVRGLFADDPDVYVLEGDRRELEAEAPFDLLFVDATAAKADPEAIGLLAPGGTALLDDLTPGYVDPDPVRELWLGHPHLASVELTLTPTLAVILAVRVR